MGKIIYLMGKSSSGKDTVYKELMSLQAFKFKKVVMYTTRPCRDTETDGVQYHFVDEDKYKELLDAGKIIEHRAYDTYHGVWRYFTVDDGNVDLSNNNYLVIGTIESFLKIRDYYGTENVLPIYLEIDDGIRLQRALSREMLQENPKYEEMCRRFLADKEDFSEENIAKAHIGVRFNNEKLSECLEQIEKYLMEQI